MTVFIAFIVASVWGVNVDGYIGILVSIIIGLSGVGVLKEVFSNLIGQAPESSLLLEIKQKILSYTGVLGVHDLSVYCYGPNKYFASAHVEVDAKEDILVSHELVDKIEKDIMTSMNIILTGHLDPIVTDDERVNTLKEKIEKIVENIDSSFSIHDFRMVFGKNQTNVLFDVAVPYESTISKEEIRAILEREVAKIDKKYCLVITIESCI
jgi:divalent metal cation (Fe/Co/Zn/Cd) transporter